MTELAKEYGEALYELARDEDLRPQFLEERREIRDCVSGQPDFIRLLCSRAIERKTRIQIIQDTFGGQAHPYIVSFMKLLVEKEHFDAFLMCCQWFHDRYNEDYGIVEAHVTSAIPLTPPELDALCERLETISGHRVDIIADVDPAVIGGVRVEMDGRRYDNTIQNRLGRLRRSLKQGL